LTIPDYRALKIAFEERKAHLMKPDGVNQLYLADLAPVKVRRSRVHLLLVMDYFSRHLLTLKIYTHVSTEELIRGLENALEEAVRLTSLKADQIIILATSDRLTVLDERTTHYLEMSPFYHISERIFYPQLTGMRARLWRTIREEGELFDNYVDYLDNLSRLNKFLWDYNHIRPHEALKYQTPYEVYTGTRAIFHSIAPKPINLL
jgi:putative transposase